MNFLKMEGLGNDFLVTHEVSSGMVQTVARHASRICDRRRGVGADGLIFVLPSRRADFRMRIINSDGSEAEMCGNGIRCFALYVKLLQLTDLNHLVIETAAGEIITDTIDDCMVKVNMGSPAIDASRIPVAQNSGTVIMKEMSIGDKSFQVTAVSMGNPHAVIYSGELTDSLVHGYGKQIESHPFFPKKTNVEFIKVLSQKEIEMRVWERGCGETQACGTGACASVVSGIINKKHGNDITVHLPGGKLQIQWSGNLSDPVFMTGPARKVFEGIIEI
ncbi:MAG TPA: diaminopimelate epimerase [Chitinispirillaceae bacterium]|nr:diaminopimelate epimerase [Chitinispirillaceae bacterium]